MSDPSLGPVIELSQETLHLSKFVGNSPPALKAKAFAQRVAGSSQTILLRGETGAGKDHLAEIIHNLGRYGRPFVTVDCGALPETLLEAELFGHTRGAFTGAFAESDGLMRAAEKGTIFVNEIGNMGLSFQAKLLGILDGKPFRPIGGSRSFRVEARIIAATNANLEDRVAKGQFRADLFYRLNGVPFSLAPLRERQEDIPLLLRAIVKDAARFFSPRAIDALKKYPWPGNVREFTQVVRRAILMIEDEIDAPDLEQILGVGQETITAPSPQTEVIFPALMPRFEDLERMYYRQLFIQCKGDKRKMSSISGISVKTIYNRLNMYKFDLSTE